MTNYNKNNCISHLYKYYMKMTAYSINSSPETVIYSLIIGLSMKIIWLCILYLVIYYILLYVISQTFWNRIMLRILNILQSGIILLPTIWHSPAFLVTMPSYTSISMSGVKMHVWDIHCHSNGCTMTIPRDPTASQDGLSCDISGQYPWPYPV